MEKTSLMQPPPTASDVFAGMRPPRETIDLIARRPDGSLIIRRHGHPYHVTSDDPLWDAVKAAADHDPPPLERPVVQRPPNPIAVIEAHVEGVARSMGYSSASSCAGYSNSTVPQWAAEAAAFVAWRDAVWLAVFARKDEAPPTTEAEVIALLPAWVPPQG